MPLIPDSSFWRIREWGRSSRFLLSVLAGEILRGAAQLYFDLSPFAVVGGVGRVVSDHVLTAHQRADLLRYFGEFVRVVSGEGAAASDQGSSKGLVGMDLRGKVYFVDLAADCPHILVGGSAGCGKSEWLRAAVAGLIVTNTPETLRLAVADPKKITFTELANSPFLWRPDALVDSPDSSVLSLLEDLAGEMTGRYLLFKEAAADNLVQYRRKTGQKLPRVVMVVDEFAELLLAGARKQRDEFERLFIRVAGVGRAAGIHLILATQRPDRKVVSGNLKANLPAKIAMRVANFTNSGILIDQGGAERLLGTGDLLLAGIFSDPVRLQSACVSEEERRRIFRGADSRRA